MKISILSLTVAAGFLFAASPLIAQEEEKPKPEKMELTGTIKKAKEGGSIALVTEEKKRYLIIKKLHEKVQDHINKKVTITGGVMPGKKEGTNMFVYIGKLKAAEE